MDLILNHFGPCIKWAFWPLYYHRFWCKCSASYFYFLTQVFCLLFLHSGYSSSQATMSLSGKLKMSSQIIRLFLILKVHSFNCVKNICLPLRSSLNSLTKDLECHVNIRSVFFIKKVLVRNPLGFFLSLAMFWNKRSLYLKMTVARDSNSVFLYILTIVSCEGNWLSWTGAEKRYLG